MHCVKPWKAARRAARLLPLLTVLVSACNNGDDDEDMTSEPEPPAPQRGDLIGGAPTLVASYTPQQLLDLASSNEVAQQLAEQLLSPDCTVDVYHLDYQTVDPA